VLFGGASGGIRVVMKLHRLISTVSLLGALFMVTATGWAQAPPPPGYGQNGPDQGGQYGAPPPPGSPDQAYPDQNGQMQNYPDENGPNGPDQAAPGEDNEGPPGRVARLQFMSGSVSIQPHGTDDWVQGAVNRPLTNADNVWADKDSRAELNLGTGIVRINNETSLTLTNITDNSAQLTLHQGALNVHVRHLFQGEVYEIDTPNLAFTVQKPGDYRFDVDPNADYTVVTVWRGEGQATGQGQPVTVHENETGRFTSGTSLTHEMHAVSHPDSFDDWCRLRDQRADHSMSSKYVSPDEIGSEDLDEYGTWKQEEPYGNVWVPNDVDPGWAPYTYGQWEWIAPWGWTWVDNAPWGFAPFHYGRWVWGGGYWGWAPGPYYGYWHRGWWAPGLVAWFGGPGWGVGLGFGGFGFGWCPLGWGEPFFPWYHAGWGYFRGINVYNTRIVNINHFHGTFNNFVAHGSVAGVHYANMNRPGGFTAVSSHTLQNALPVHNNMVHVSADAARNAPSLGRPGVSPSRSGMLGPKAGAAAAHPSSAVNSRPTVSRMTPPASSARASGNAGMGESVRTNMPANHGERGPATRPESSSSAARNVPRPPGATNEGARTPGASSNRAAPPSSSARSVPRPPSAGGTTSRPGATAGTSRPGGNMGYNSGRSEGYSSRSYGSSGGYSSRSYGASPSGGYSRSAPYGGYTGGFSHGSSAYGGYGSRSYGGYSGRTYSAPSRSYGSGSRGGGFHGGGSPHGGGFHGGGGGHRGR